MNNFYIVQDNSGKDGDILFWNYNKQKWEYDFNHASIFPESIFATPLPGGSTEVWEYNNDGLPIAVHKITSLPKIN